jgi:hypothetical protein
MKFCKKDNCNEIAILRGKYCETHKTVKRRQNTNINTPINNLEYMIPSSFKNSQIEENRKLIEEQELEYQRTLNMDRERIRLKDEENELEKILKLSEISFNEEKRKKIKDEPLDNYYLIQFNTPNGKKTKRKFSKVSTIQDIKNYLDIYFIDNNLEIKNYDLCYYSSANCKQLIKTESNNEILENIFNSNNFALFIINNDA